MRLTYNVSKCFYGLRFHLKVEHMIIVNFPQILCQSTSFLQRIAKLPDSKSGNNEHFDDYDEEKVFLIG